MNRKSHVPAPNTGESKPIAPSIFPEFESEIQTPETEVPAFRARALATPGWETPVNAHQDLIDMARARAFIYRFLARCFDLPTPKEWQWLCNPTVHTMLCSAVKHLVSHGRSTVGSQLPTLSAAHQLVVELHPGQFEPFVSDYLLAFGETQSLPHRLTLPLTTLSQLMQRFGLSLAPSGASTTADYLCVSFEFASWLVVQQAAALENGKLKEARLHHEAKQKLLREHLPAWLTVLSSKQVHRLQPGLLRLMVTFTLEFLALEQLHASFRLHARAKVSHSSRVTVRTAFR